MWRRGGSSCAATISRAANRDQEPADIESVAQGPEAPGRGGGTGTAAGDPARGIRAGRRGAADVDRARGAGNVDAPQEVRAGTAADPLRPRCHRHPGGSAAGPSTRCCDPAHGQNEDRRDQPAGEARSASGARPGAARPPSAVGVVRGAHHLDPLLAGARAVPLRQLAVDPRADGGAGRSEDPARLDHRLDPDGKTTRRRTRPLLHHRQPARARPCGSTRPTTTPRTRARAASRSSSTSARRCAPSTRPTATRSATATIHFANGMTLWVLGAHNKTNLQRRSIRWLVGDETWRWPHGPHGRGRGAGHRIRVAGQVPLHEPGRRGGRRHPPQVRDHRPARVDLRVPALPPAPAVQVGAASSGARTPGTSSASGISRRCGDTTAMRCESCNHYFEDSDRTRRELNATGPLRR